MLTFPQGGGQRYNGSAGTRPGAWNEAICYWCSAGGAIDHYGSFNAGQERWSAVSQNRVPRTASLNSPEAAVEGQAIAGLFNGRSRRESASATSRATVVSCAVQDRQREIGQLATSSTPFRGFMGATFEDGSPCAMQARWRRVT